MNNPIANERSSLAFREMKQAIDASHPQGWFVAIADERILGVAADFHQLEGMLRAQGKDPRHLLVVEAGVNHPEYVTIFA